MPKSDDIELGRTAVAEGFIKPEQLAVSLQTQQARLQNGERVPLEQILLEKNFLTASQLKILKKETSLKTESSHGALTRVKPQGQTPVTTETRPIAHIVHASNTPAHSPEATATRALDVVKNTQRDVPVNNIIKTEKRTRQGILVSNDTNNPQNQTALADERPVTKMRPISTTTPLDKKFFGRYELLEEVGRGGMGQVYRAHDPQLDRTVALKVMLSNTSQEACDRFLREAKTMAKLQHPNIAAIYDLGENSNQVFFVMEFIEGVTLDHADRHRMNLGKLLEIIAKIADALDHAHSQGIVHRDIKPGNIMLDEKDYEPKVMDFGLAKLLESTSPHSQEGMLIGTLSYMSPEQADGRIDEIDGRSDIYSLGVILYELVTGKAPYTGKTFTEMLTNILQTEPESITKINSQLPRQLDRIIRKAMSKNKRQRYTTAGEFAKELRGILDQNKGLHQVKIRHNPFAILNFFKQLPCKPWMYWTGGGVVACIMLIILVFAFRDKEAPTIVIQLQKDPQANSANTPPPDQPNPNNSTPNTPPPTQLPLQESQAKEAYEALAPYLGSKDDVTRWELLHEFVKQHPQTQAAEKATQEQRVLNIKFQELIQARIEANEKILLEKRWSDFDPDVSLLPWYRILPPMAVQFPEYAGLINKEKMLVADVSNAKFQAEKEANTFYYENQAKLNQTNLTASWKVCQTLPPYLFYTKYGKEILEHKKNLEEQILKQITDTTTQLQFIKDHDISSWPQFHRSQGVLHPDYWEAAKQIEGNKAAMQKLGKLIVQTDEEYRKQQEANTKPPDNSTTSNQPNTTKPPETPTPPKDPPTTPAIKISGKNSFPSAWKKTVWQSCWKEELGYVDFSESAWIKLSDSSKISYAKAYQKWYADQIQSPVERTFRTTGISISVILIPPGCFMMGSPSSEKERGEDEALHKVAISQVFWITKYEIFQSQWFLPMGNNPSSYKNSDAPVETISWEQANAYAEKLGMRLPTESEWEYACRAGTTTPFYLGENITTTQVNYDGKSPYNKAAKGKSRNRPVAVGTISYPNPWGCYYFHGNVAEWCSDWYGAYPSDKLNLNPTGQNTGSGKVIRGGSFSSSGEACRSAKRAKIEPSESKSHIGLRLVLEYQQK